MTRIKTILSILLLTGFLSSAYAQTIVDRHGQLSVEGTKVKDECGRTAQLKGMSFFWHQWDRSSEYMNRDVMEKLRDDWKVEIVRIPIAVRDGDPCSVLGTRTLAAGECGGSNPGGVTGKRWAYDVARRAIQAAVDAGIYVIVDWHAHPNKRTEAKEFFRTMAQEFGQYPNVIYEIYNEPTGSSWTDLDQDWPELKAYSRDLIATIRQHDPDNLIVCPTPFYDQFVHQAADDPITVDIDNNPVSNIAYCLHIYADAHRFDGQPGSWAKDALQKGLPMFVTESGATATDFGQPRSTGRNQPNYPEYDKWRGWWDDNGISFCTWSMSIKDEYGSSLLPGASTAGNWNNQTDLSDEGRQNRNYFRAANSLPSVCDDNPNPTANVRVRARMLNGSSDQLQLRVNNQTVKTWTISGSSYQEYTHTISQGGNVKLYFPDNGTDLEVDWLRVEGTTYQAEAQEVNTSVWENGSCGGDFSQVMHCAGHIDFGTINVGSGGSGEVVIRARGNCGSETMILEVGGSNVKTWTNVGTSYTNYRHSGYSGGTIKVKFTNNASSPCDRNLYVDYIDVCGSRIQSESAGVVQTTSWSNGDKQVLFTNGDNNYGNPGCSGTAARSSEVGRVLDNANGQSLVVYPNPSTQGEVTVVGTGQYDVSIYDAQGKRVYQVEQLIGVQRIKTGKLLNGLYMVKMHDRLTDRIEMTKLVIRQE